MNVSFIGGGILDGYATALLEVESTAGDRLSALSTSPGSIGSTLVSRFYCNVSTYDDLVPKT